MEQERKPVRLLVTFEADDDYELVDAVFAFMEEIVANGIASKADDGWRYKTETPSDR